MLAQYSVQWYGRYRDDILIIARRGVGVQSLFHQLKLRAKGVWDITCSEVSGHGMSFLDFELYKGKHFTHTGQLSYKLYRKPTNQLVPLGSSSMHTRNVHTSWPRAEICRIARRNFNFSDFMNSVTSTLSRWSKFDLSHCSDSLCLPTIFHSRGYHTKNGGTKSRVFWLVLPYHARFNVRPIRDSINTLVAHWSQALKNVIGDFELRLSFRSYFPTLAARCNRHNMCLVR